MDKEEIYSASRHFDEDINVRDMRSIRNRNYLIVFLAFVVFVQVIALSLLTPLKQIQPYIVTVEKESGISTFVEAMPDSSLTYGEALRTSNLVKYVNFRESYFQPTARRTVALVESMSANRALVDFQALWSKNNPDNPSEKYGNKAKITVHIKGVPTYPSDNVAIVRFKREVHYMQRKTVSHWAATINYDFLGGEMTYKQLFANPTNFVVTDYKLSQEALEN